MNIAVVAANGRSGSMFVNAALEAGYGVRAGVRGAYHFAAHPNLTIIECDATNSEGVARLIEGADAVVSLLGHVKGSPKWVQTDAMKVIVEQMRRQEIRRIISLTGTGVRRDGDKPTLLDYILNTSIRLIDPARVKDGIAHAQVLDESGLDVTILRVLKLTDGDAGVVHLTPHGPVEVFSSRARVAQAILEILQNDSWISQYPILSKEPR